MAKKTNAELAAEYIKMENDRGIEIWKEKHKNSGHVFLYILKPGKGGGNSSSTDLCKRILAWLQSQEIVKSEKQIKNIAKVVFTNAKETLV